MPEKLKIVALVGRPNVGKSSIFNRITRQTKAIIDSAPGVTRDRHFERVVFDDRMFILVDTGGIEFDLTASGHDASEARISGLIREQSWQAVNDADLIVLVLDGKEGLTRDDYELTAELRKAEKPLFFLVNKIDDPVREQERLSTFYGLGVPNLWPVSAAHGLGMNDFLEELVSHIEPSPAVEEAPMDAIRLAFIGRPNVGKSSLVNRLLGEERMVVSEVPGTTRDSVDTMLDHSGRHYLLIDTAGIRRKGKVEGKVEKFSVMRALRSMEECDIALILLDASEGITEQDTKVIGYSVERGRACLVVMNKWDTVKNDPKRQKWLLNEIEMATRFIGYAPVVTLSAMTGQGVNKIFGVIDKVFSQFSSQVTTGRLNRVLQKAVLAHPPALHQGRRLKFYYTTQVATKPPTFLVYVNYPKGVHFSYFRFLVNQFREELGLDFTTLKIILKERERKDYGKTGPAGAL
jgi:GTP-binding protein